MAGMAPPIGFDGYDLERAWIDREFLEENVVGGSGTAFRFESSFIIFSNLVSHITTLGEGDLEMRSALSSDFYKTLFIDFNRFLNQDTFTVGCWIEQQTDKLFAISALFKNLGYLAAHIPTPDFRPFDPSGIWWLLESFLAYIPEDGNCAIDHLASIFQGLGSLSFPKKIDGPMRNIASFNALIRLIALQDSYDNEAAVMMVSSLGQMASTYSIKRNERKLLSEHEAQISTQGILACLDLRLASTFTLKQLVKILYGLRGLILKGMLDSPVDMAFVNRMILRMADHAPFRDEDDHCIIKKGIKILIEGRVAEISRDAQRAINTMFGPELLEHLNGVKEGLSSTVTHPLKRLGQGARAVDYGTTSTPKERIKVRRGWCAKVTQGGEITPKSSQFAVSMVCYCAYDHSGGSSNAEAEELEEEACAH